MNNCGFVCCIEFSGGGFGYDFAWDTIFVFYIFFCVCFFGGADFRIQECFDYWNIWLLVICGCKFEAELVISNASYFVFNVDV
jgi:hypothetical protein